MKHLLTALMLLASLSSFADQIEEGPVDEKTAEIVIKALKNQVDRKNLVCPYPQSVDAYNPEDFLSAMVLKPDSVVSISEDNSQPLIKVSRDDMNHHWVVNFSTTPDQKVITKISYSFRLTLAGEDNIGTLTNPIFIPSQTVIKKLDMDCVLQ